MAGKQWTAEEDAILAKEFALGKTREEIARVLGRTHIAVGYRYRLLEDKLLLEERKKERIRQLEAKSVSPQENRKERKCLCCGKMFLSHYSMNRICRKCRQKRDLGLPDNMIFDT
ncbi:MAG: hypothetical protein LBD68_08370 [Zoogloeaceae bacterium]|jgi:hypothetical protein|nr:hypothetical protein [Zoogloeaceae bacterium]